MTNAEQFKELYTEQLTNEEKPTFRFQQLNADTNWQDEIFQKPGFITSNNISITGASEKHSFYLGVEIFALSRVNTGRMRSSAK